MTAELSSSQFDALQEPKGAIVLDASQPPQAIADEIVAQLLHG
jgi:gluconate kinase